MEILGKSSGCGKEEAHEFKTHEYLRMSRMLRTAGESPFRGSLVHILLPEKEFRHFTITKAGKVRAELAATKVTYKDGREILRTSRRWENGRIAMETGNLIPGNTVPQDLHRMLET